jgi:hypothetical protein
MGRLGGVLKEFYEVSVQTILGAGSDMPMLAALHILVVLLAGCEPSI